MGVLVAVLAMFVMVDEAYGQRSSTRISSNDGTYRYTHKSGSNRFEVEYDGKIEFTDDDKAIKSISRGGFLRIRKTSFGNRRELLAEPNSDGTINYQVYEGRRKVEFEDEARKWLADIILEVVRTTGIGAEGRVKRFYGQGGTDAVLKEVDEIRSDFVSHIYLKELLDTKNLSDNELVKIAGYVPSELDSDHYITEVFKDYGDLFFKTDKATEAFLGSIRRMDSDHYVSIILKRALREDLNDAMVIKVLDAADIMDSDHYKTNVFKDLLDRRDLSDNVIDQIVKSAADIDSDHYATIVLRDALDRPNLSDKAFENLIEAVAHIDSDHYVTETFRSMLRGRDVSEKVVEAVLDKLEYMDSDHYRNLIISDLIRDQDLKSQHFTDILNTLDDIDSDHYATQIIKKILDEQELSAQDYDKVLEKVGDMDSDHYRTNILKDVLNERLSKTQLLSVLKSADNIDSDYYKSEVLKDACRQVSDADEEVKKMYRSVARGIRSDTYYGRVARCID